MFVFGIISIEVWPTQFPVWAFVLALIIAFVYVIPIGMIQAITNQQIGLNVITELIIGYILPGKPIAMMMFKVRHPATPHHPQPLTPTADLGLHLHGPSPLLHLRLQTGALHEDPAAANVLVPNCRDRHRGYRPARRRELVRSRYLSAWHGNS